MFNFFNNKKDKKRIGILYICTGKYHIFWDQFYKSANEFFCKNSEVHYFVYTENPINTFDNEKVHHIVQPRLGWPYDTLKRFHLFIEQREKLEAMDYLFFFNANMSLKQKVREKEILPKKNSNGLTSVIHPCTSLWGQTPPPFEDNKDSTAYVKADPGMNYFQGCLSGGRTKEYLIMAEAIIKMADIDLNLRQPIIAKWWDESYMNKYFQSYPPQPLPPSFAYPESMNLPFGKKIVQLDKGKFGGHDFLRN
jgi:glycosyl transferase family 6